MPKEINVWYNFGPFLKIEGNKNILLQLVPVSSPYLIYGKNFIEYISAITVMRYGDVVCPADDPLPNRLKSWTQNKSTEAKDGMI